MVRHLTVFHLASRDKAVSATKRLISFLKISTKTHDYVDDADGGFTVCFVSVSQICLKQSSFKCCEGCIYRLIQVFAQQITRQVRL